MNRLKGIPRDETGDGKSGSREFMLTVKRGPAVYKAVEQFHVKYGIRAGQPDQPDPQSRHGGETTRLSSRVRAFDERPVRIASTEGGAHFGFRGSKPLNGLQLPPVNAEELGCSLRGFRIEPTSAIHSIDGCFSGDPYRPFTRGWPLPRRFATELHPSLTGVL